MVGAIDGKRKEIRKRIHATIEDVIDARSTIRTNATVSHSCVPGCGIAEICSARLIQSLKQSGLYPLKAIMSSTIQELIRNTMSAKHVRPEEALTCASPGCIGRTENLSNGTIKYLLYTGIEIDQALLGPCLTRFNEDELDQLGGCKHFKVTPANLCQYCSAVDLIV